MKYSANELEILGVVLATEHFRNCLYDSDFEFDSKKTMHIRLTRLVISFLPFNFKISHLAGKDMGFTDF